MRLRHCNNIADFRQIARRRLPTPVFHYIDGGADDEWSLHRNTAAFDDYQLIPDYLRDVSSVSLETRILGKTLDLPFFLSPTGMSRLFHHDKELAACRAADRYRTLYSLSTMATTSLEEVAAATSGPARQATSPAQVVDFPTGEEGIARLPLRRLSDTVTQTNVRRLGTRR